MATNIQTLSIHNIEYVFWAIRNGNYPYGATGTLANGSDAGMVRYRGAASFAVTVPEAPSVPIIGDGGKLGDFKGRVLESTTGVFSANVYDELFHTASEGRNIYTDNQFPAQILSDTCVDYAPMVMVLNSRAQSQETATLGQKGWLVTEVWNVEAQGMMGEMSGVAFEPVVTSFNLTVNSVATEPTGLAVSSTNYGVSRGFIKQYWSENPVHFVTHVGDGTDVAVTLPYTPAANSGAKVSLWQNGVAKTYTTDYTVAGTAFTFVAAPTAGMVSIIRYEFTADC
jgi:hypothetical protein